MPDFNKGAGLLSINRNNGDLRKDGTRKGQGFLGILKRPDGKVSTELSVSSSDVVDKNGNEVLFPLLVPTLTQKEINSLLADGKVSDDIFGKAIDHARNRLRLGFSPFAQDAPSEFRGLE